MRALISNLLGQQNETRPKALLTNYCRSSSPRAPYLDQQHPTRGTGGHHPSPTSQRRRDGEMLCVTPRQTCLQPSGIGRNLRSKTRWFTGFCNSHQVSHFATFFIDARAEISVAESRLCSLIRCRMQLRAKPGAHGLTSIHIPWRIPRWDLLHALANIHRGH